MHIHISSNLLVSIFQFALKSVMLDYNLSEDDKAHLSNLLVMMIEDLLRSDKKHIEICGVDI